MTTAIGGARAANEAARPIYLRRELGTGAAPVTIANRGDDPGMANRVDQRRSEGRSVGGEERLHRVARSV